MGLFVVIGGCFLAVGLLTTGFAVRQPGPLPRLQTNVEWWTGQQPPIRRRDNPRAVALLLLGAVMLLVGVAVLVLPRLA